jgi:hypothetical protein
MKFIIIEVLKITQIHSYFLQLGIHGVDIKLQDHQSFLNIILGSLCFIDGNTPVYYLVHLLKILQCIKDLAPLTSP